MSTSIEREEGGQHMTTRIFALLTGIHATRANNFLPFSLKELRPDDSGDVVIDHESGSDVTVLTDDAVTGRGIEQDHITGDGYDVSGFAYCRFADGVTVFYPRSHALTVNENALAL
jgi:hypothetical protein